MVKHLVTRANVCRFWLPVKQRNLNLDFLINSFLKYKEKKGEYEMWSIINGILIVY